MTDLKHDGRIARFGEFEVDLRAGVLKRRGQRIRLQEKPFQILALLLEHSGDVVTREELRERLWPADTFVDFDSSVNTALKKLRQALEDPADEPIYIKTVPRKGYRFVAPILSVEATASFPATPMPSGPAHGSATPHSQANSAARIGFDSREPRTWLASAAMLVAAVALIVFALNRAHPAPGVRAAAGKILLFVSPFTNLSGDPGEEYFTDGLTDEMITQVGREYPARLAVIARASSMQYKNAHKPLSKIAAELGGVDYVLEGSVRRSGDAVTINAQLFRASDGSSLWAETYVRPKADIVTIQRDVAGRIVQSLAHELLPPPAAAPELASTSDPAAYDDYLRGLYQLNKRTREGQRRALEYLQHSVQKDPRFAQAWAALGYSYVVAGSWGFLSPRDSYPKAEEAARKAIELDESLAEAHVTLGEALHVYDWNWTEAEKEFRRALDLDPNSAMVRKMYAEYLHHAGKHAEALGEAERAQKLDPLSLIITAQVGLYYVYMNNLDQAVLKFKEATEIDPLFAPAHYYLGAAYHFQNKDAQAIPELELARKLSDDTPEMSVKLVCAYQAVGRKRDAQQTLLDLKRRARHEFISATAFAEIYMEMGDNEQAVAWLEKAAAERDYAIMSLRAFGEVKEIGGDPRYQKILAAVAFPDAAPQLASVTPK